MDKSYPQPVDNSVDKSEFKFGQAKKSYEIKFLHDLLHDLKCVTGLFTNFSESC